MDGKNHALAYVCDGRGGEGGKPFEWSINELFSGQVVPVRGGSLDLISKGGAHLVAEVAKEGASGTITLDGQDHAFRAEPAEAPAGLYWATETVEGEDYVGGWIEPANHEERGAVRNTATGTIQDNEGTLIAHPDHPVEQGWLDDLKDCCIRGT